MAASWSTLSPGPP
uniref:Uncharacterized protein n=1 Tax=Arundo donax TaxID=35708 RepID=A0A0A8YFS0_ARUDO